MRLVPHRRQASSGRRPGAVRPGEASGTGRTKPAGLVAPDTTRCAAAAGTVFSYLTRLTRLAGRRPCKIDILNAKSLFGKQNCAGALCRCSGEVALHPRSRRRFRRRKESKIGTLHARFLSGGTEPTFNRGDSPSPATLENVPAGQRMQDSDKGAQKLPAAQSLGPVIRGKSESTVYAVQNKSRT